jgi:Rieske Fe-S protein
MARFDAVIGREKQTVSFRCEEKSRMGDGLNRREFVAAGAAVACLCVIGPAPAQAAPAGATVDVGTAQDYPSDRIVDRFARQHKFFVVRAGDQIYAMTTKCTHKGCDLGLRNNAIKCRCHGSEFSSQGTPTAGPAKLPLIRYAISLDGQRLIVDKSKQFDESQWNDPASFARIG